MHIVHAKTEIYAILGDPISHSLSPVIMNRSFERFNMEKVFLAFRCSKANIHQVIQALKKVDLKGYVLTMPLKETVGDLLDRLEDEAAITEAVNCIQNVNGTLIGYNTDSIGFWTAVEEKKLREKEIHNIFVLGMGGFSKAAVTQAALKEVKEITVVNRLEEKEIVDGFNEFLNRLNQYVPELQVTILPWEPEKWSDNLGKADIIVNATPNGLHNKGDLHNIFPYTNVKQDAIFFDALYDPVITKFLEIAKDRGHQIIDGLDLLAHQGVCSFEIWTGKRIDPKVMKEDALMFLRVKQED